MHCPRQGRSQCIAESVACVACWSHLSVWGASRGPIISFSLVIGLCVDYDIFLSNRIYEMRDRGFGDVEAIKLGFAFSAGTITVAGVIMMVRVLHRSDPPPPCSSLLFTLLSRPICLTL